MLLIPTLYFWHSETAAGKRFANAMTQTEASALHYSNRKPLLVFIGLLGAVSAALVAHFISRIQLYFAAKQYLLDSLTKLYHNEGYQLYYAAFEKRKIFTF